MNNLPGLGSLRMLPINGALNRCQIWQRALSKTINSQNSSEGPVSAILSTYRSVRCRLMRKMSVAMIRRRSSLNFLEKKPIDAQSVANAGHARLPVTMRHYPKTLTQKRSSIGIEPPMMMPTSNVWASLHAQRSFATMSDRLDRAKATKRPKTLTERPVVPILELINPEEATKLKGIETGDAAHISILRSSKLTKESPPLPVPRLAGPTQKLLPNSGKVLPTKDSVRPMVPILRFFENKDHLDGTETFRSISTGPKPKEQRRLAPFLPLRCEADSVAKRREAQKDFALRRSSSVQYLMAKHPLMHKLRPPTLSILKSNELSQNVETFETRLRALRTAQPLKLKVPSPADIERLTITQKYRGFKLPRQPQVQNTFPRMGKKYGPKQSFRSATVVLPSIKAYRMTLPKKIIRNKKPRYQKPAQKLQPTKSIDMNETTTKTKKSQMMLIHNKRPERENLNDLLGDLLDKKKPSTPQLTESISFHKIAPLFKLVTTSVEGRSNLHNRRFEKQLESPQLYRHPIIRNINQSPSVNRRAIFMGQSAAYRAKAILENKLNILLRADQEEDDEEEDEDAN
ncbi:uncharacterized protein [Drosophila virilis]|uniref:Uncharacterized protein n=1 Tax=Drosophila virilis TaxID=7244 RepID=B4MEU6_DROVI|nr:uncharacterized protein LOC6636107 [Drosophila virilis]EDW63071.1 uncharacterized protein Dvir_GJ14705 [Drosophila virilis]